MRRRWRTAGWTTATLIAIFALAVWALSVAVRQPPPFYALAVAVPGEEQQAAGYLLEQSVLDLHNDAQRHGPWQAVFTPRQVNGWLAIDLPAKFPDLLPPSVGEPRVAVIDGRLHVACRYQNERLATVISLELEITLAAEPETLAIRFCRARAGLLPLPMKRILNDLSQAAHDGHVTLRWGTAEGDPVALLALPPLDRESSTPLHLTAIDLREGKIFVTGDSGVSEPTRTPADGLPPGGAGSTTRSSDHGRTADDSSNRTIQR